MPLLPWFTKKTSNEQDKASSDLYRLTGMGIELTASVLGMTLVGYLLDRWLGTSPWLLVSFAIMGIVGGTYNFIKGALEANRSSQRGARRSSPAPPTTRATTTDNNSATSPTTSPSSGEDADTPADEGKGGSA